jgi:hypothetical protein
MKLTNDQKYLRYIAKLPLEKVVALWLTGNHRAEVFNRIQKLVYDLPIRS